MRIEIVTFRIVDHYNECILDGVYYTEKAAKDEVERLIKGHKLLSHPYDYDVDKILPGVTYQEYCDKEN